MDRERERQELEKAQLVRGRAIAKDNPDSQPVKAQNVVLVLRAAIAALQAAQLLPTD